ncbi:helix-turn-helix domain-containing protein [Candidatus Microgenomates bacterium]|nr:helix-turn-helix domain-containing protein [Candidatus Microgenomates bacterium]
MTTVSELLKKARQEKQLSFSDIEKETKIKSSFIRALEEGDYDKLPSAIYARGFLKNYAQFLGLDTQLVLALFRREFASKQENTLLPGQLSKIPTKSLRITFMALLFFIFLAILASYFFIQYKNFLGNPNLSVTHPTEQEVIAGDTITIVGKTDADVQLIINETVVLVSPDGSFSQKLTALPGSLTITVVAKNRYGRESKVVRVVNIK